MSNGSRDRELGMHRKITRRDFLNGVSLAIGGSLVASQMPRLHAATGSTATYPPALTGIHGQQNGSYTYAHQLRDGDFWDKAGKPQETGEKYDLVVVGGGISGLAAAYFFRQHAGPKARILILDALEDFGGHAQRNEFRVSGRMLLSNAGTQSIESPSAYSEVAKQLLKEIGIEPQRFYKDYDQNLYSNLKTACFFNREKFGRDRLVLGMGARPWEEFLQESPLSERARTDIARLYNEKVDHLPGLSPEEKEKKLAKMSYADYLTKICHASPEVLPFFQTYPHDLYAVGIDAVAALSCYESPDDYKSFTYAGFGGIGLEPPEKEEPYIFHFPDGNASIARLLVRSLIPGSVPGHTMEDVVTARADYARLDDPKSPVRIRLKSTAVRARHVGDPKSAKAVEVIYARAGKLYRVEAAKCVLACFNTMIPYLCPEIPEKQKESLAYGVKEPLVYTHVALRNWTSFHKLGIQQIVAPAGYHTLTKLDFPVNIGNYKFPSTPEEPMVLFMLRTPCQPGLPAREQYRAGRYELIATSFEEFERNIRDQLQRMLGETGFESARDIAAITVNRWAHGYAYEYNSLWDPDLPRSERPCVLGRKQFGRISIANSDAGGRAYSDCAIDEAYRAVQEQVATF
jgi:spermidine dehydrogenase